MMVSSFWDMRLSAATDAEYQNRIIHHGTLNLPVVAQQPHPDPNCAPHTAARRVASTLRTKPWRAIVSMAGARSLLYGALICALHELLKSIFYFSFYKSVIFFVRTHLL